MPLLFANFKHVQQALLTGIIPAEVAGASATVSHGDNGQIAITPKVKLPVKKKAELEKAGIKDTPKHFAGTVTVTCWPEVMPLIDNRSTLEITPQTRVIFAVTDDATVQVLVQELLRLNNDRIGIQHLESTSLLNVIGPPYYTLLRALDPQATVKAYIEATPRVWVRAGYSHPLSASLKVPEDRLLFIDPPNAWTFTPNELFEDVYTQLNIRLPQTKLTESVVPAPSRIPVALQFRPANSAESAGLWVLESGNLSHVETLARTADSKLLQRLRFAVTTNDSGVSHVVIKAMASRTAPPQLNLDGAVEYRSYAKLPNLFVPLHCRLHPQLRREALRTLLAPEAEEIVWLSPTANNGFVPHTVRDAAFRRFEDWVEYVIDREREALSTWVKSATFDFAPFICPEPAPKTKPTPPPATRPIEPKGKEPQTVAPPAPPGPPVSSPVKPTEPSHLVKWKAERARLEEAFLGGDGALDRADRKDAWPALAAVNVQLGDTAEAAIAFQNALWIKPSVELNQSWALAENAKATGEVLAQFMVIEKPTQGEARAAAAAFLAKPMATNLPALQAAFTRHESLLSTRVVWLVAQQFHAVNGGDALALTRTRDRLLRRLLDNGIHAERELPGFLRLDGNTRKDALRESRDRARNLGEQVRSWVVASVNGHKGTLPTDRTNTPAYVDMLFAYAHARLGETDAANKHIELARAVLCAEPESVSAEATIAQLLFEGMKIRVTEVLAGKANAEPLPTDWLSRLNTEPYQQTKTMIEYAILRMREQSRVLDPFEKLNPYAAYTKHSEPMRRAIAELPKRRPEELGKIIQQLWSQGVGTKPTAEDLFALLHQALPLAARVGEDLTADLITKLPEVIKSVGATADSSNDTARKLAFVFDRALFLAAHFGRGDLVTMLTETYTAKVREKPPERKYELVSAVASQGLRSMKKLGMTDAAVAFLTALQKEILPENSIVKLRADTASRPKIWAEALRAVLNLAGGWCGVGRADLAEPALQQARAELLPPSATKFEVLELVNVVRAYVAALGQATANDGLPRLLELFTKLNPAAIPVTFTTARYFSRHHLNLTEDVVFALTGEDFGLSESGKYWRDEDERIVREKIHKDVKEALHKAGLG